MAKRPQVPNEILEEFEQLTELILDECGARKGELRPALTAAMVTAYAMGRLNSNVAPGRKTEKPVWKKIPAKPRDLLWNLCHADLDQRERGEGRYAGLAWQQYGYAHQRWLRVAINSRGHAQILDEERARGWSDIDISPLLQFGMIEKDFFDDGVEEHEAGRSQYLLCVTWKGLFAYADYARDIGNEEEARRVQRISDEDDARIRREERETQLFNRIQAEFSAVTPAPLSLLLKRDWDGWPVGSKRWLIEAVRREIAARAGGGRQIFVPCLTKNDMIAGWQEETVGADQRIATRGGGVHAHDPVIPMIIRFAAFERLQLKDGSPWRGPLEVMALSLDAVCYVATRPDVADGPQLRQQMIYAAKLGGASAGAAEMLAGLTSPQPTHYLSRSTKGLPRYSMLAEDETLGNILPAVRKHKPRPIQDLMAIAWDDLQPFEQELFSTLGKDDSSRRADDHERLVLVPVRIDGKKAWRDAVIHRDGVLHKQRAAETTYGDQGIQALARRGFFEVLQIEKTAGLPVQQLDVLALSFPALAYFAMRGRGAESVEGRLDHLAQRMKGSEQAILAAAKQLRDLASHPGTGSLN